MSAQVQIAEPQLNVTNGHVASGLKRVGFDGRWYNDSGVGSYVAGLLHALALATREFELIIYEDPNNRIPGLDGLPVIHIPVDCPRYSLSQHWELRRRARKDGLDLFHSPFYGGALTLECPTVVTIHDLIPFLLPIYRWPKRQLVKAGYRAAARRAHHVIADSQNSVADARAFLKIRPDRITPIHIAPGECFHPNSEPGEWERLSRTFRIRSPYVMVSSARNWASKNLETALKALTAVRAQTGLSFQTVVYGPKAGIEAIASEGRWPGLELCVTGYVDNNDLAALFRHAELFLMPSLYEGFGLPVAEAMACGCAVVTSNTGSLPEVAGSGAQLCAPCDVGSQVSAVTNLLLNNEELRRWRKAALRRAGEFSWARTADETAAVYRRTIRDQGDSMKQI